MARNLRCVIIDNDENIISNIQSLCKKLGGIEIVKSFVNPHDFISEAENLDFDFCLLDIDMPGMSGIEVAKALRSKLVIFITGHSEFASEAFNLDAVDFIKKPVSKDRLIEGIEKVQRRSNKDLNFYLFNTDRGKDNIKISSIVYIGSFKDDNTDSRDKCLILENGTEIKLKNYGFEEILKILPKSDFSQINKSEIISHSSINRILNDEIIPSGKLEEKFGHFTISRSYSKDFKSKLN